MTQHPSTPPRHSRPSAAARRALALETASAERRRRLTHRLLPALIALGVVAFVLGLVLGGRESATERTTRNFAAAWQRQNYPAMYKMLTTGAKGDITLQGFTTAYRQAAGTATVVKIEPGKAHKTGDGARVPVTVTTRLWGTVRGSLFVPVHDGKVAWRPEMVFPGLRPGERLTRRTDAPERAKIVARDRSRIVSGPARARVVAPGPGSTIAGSVEAPKTPADRQALYARGFPLDTPIGTSGLERALQLEVEGKPGGTLLAGRRTLARAQSQPAGTVRSTIDLKTQAAADQALAGRLGGITALEPRTGKVRALEGIAFSAPQPPGSTFKMVTVTAALEAGIAKPSTVYPVETKAIIDGVGLENANGESCGGTLEHSFAESCNSVFAPLGEKLGAKRLVTMAERFGFNRPPEIPGAASSTLPPAAEIDTPLAVASSAIGQGKVLATPLQMAEIAATIANGGVLHAPTLLENGPPTPRRRVTSRRVARIVERMMVAVVTGGTGTAASLAPAIQVAGKTGTAELQSTVGPTAATEGQDAGSDTDAWFAAYAPVKRTKIAVGVLFVKAGAGGQTAAPAARVVLQQAAR